MPKATRKKTLAKKKPVRKTKAAGPDTKLWFVFPDIHFPEQDKRALATALNAHNTLKPDYSLFLGDVLDCGIFKTYPDDTIRDLIPYNFRTSEVDPTNDMLDQVQANTKTHTYFLEGNHEQRIERWAVKQGKIGESLYDLVSPATVLKSNKRPQFTMVPYSPPTGVDRGFVQVVRPKPTMTTGGLVAVHGWSHCKHAAYKHLELSRSQSIVFGHIHREQSITTRDPWTGQIVKAFSPGTLSNLQPLYFHGGTPTDWIHGFSLIYVGKRSWTSYNVCIINGRCILPDGREIYA